MDLEESLKVISVVGTTTGNAHKAVCYEVDRDWFRKKMGFEYKEAKRILNLFSLAKLILIEDMDLSVHILSYKNELESFHNMDVYYAFYDVLALGISNSVRLTQESWHQECYNQKLFSSPKAYNTNEIEIRLGLSKEDNNLLKRVKPISRIKRSDFNKLVNEKLYRSVTGLFMKVFSDRISSLVFWEEQKVLGLMLNDFNTIPLKLNYVSYEQIKAILGVDLGE